MFSITELKRFLSLKNYNFSCFGVEWEHDEILFRIVQCNVGVYSFNDPNQDFFDLFNVNLKKTQSREVSLLELLITTGCLGIFIDEDLRKISRYSALTQTPPQLIVEISPSHRIIFVLNWRQS